MALKDHYRKDYPRPQFVREIWESLNGSWDFIFDDKDVGEQLGYPQGFTPTHIIQVPFSYETKASGMQEEAFHPYVWYQKQVAISKQQLEKNVILHFQAVDYVAKVWVNGIFVGQHQGGYSAFSFDITAYLQPDSENRIIVKAEDSNSCTQPRGKQRWKEYNYGCWYVQTTGIWQSVWLEFVHPTFVNQVKMTPLYDDISVKFDYWITGLANTQAKYSITTIVSIDEQVLQEMTQTVQREQFTTIVSLMHQHLDWKVAHWSPNSPQLYEVSFLLKEDGQVVDTVHSYFGMRKIAIEHGKILLNNQPFYQRLILDQGYWQDSHLTPPSEEAIIDDIKNIMAMGYNGVRKHQKIEDARFLYWCDVLGVVVWSEAAATYEFNDEAVKRFTTEWIDIVNQHYNHPSIITWLPFNESWGIANVYNDVEQQQFTEAIYHLTKSIDAYRPVVVNDGWEHTISDILTLHDYEELGELLSKRYSDKQAIVGNRVSFSRSKLAFATGYSYREQPIIISEFGGIAFKHESGWGYGNQVASKEEFVERFRAITQAIKDLDYVCGYCYTQVSDVQQEVNGLLTEDRQPKVDLAIIKEINLAERKCGFEK
ncbi:glycoside hydrolase family 2 protein [Paenibacillus yanchengensis]|uniref:Glycoside hydrolase family 2 protein n=1 Tax=Paenibacillus yanchengensis TaxID=2035833 RepID=A0ABW4YI06_9BACL